MLHERTKLSFLLKPTKPTACPACTAQTTSPGDPCAARAPHCVPGRCQGHAPPGGTRPASWKHPPLGIPDTREKMASHVPNQPPAAPGPSSGALEQVWFCPRQRSGRDLPVGSACAPTRGICRPEML